MILALGPQAFDLGPRAVLIAGSELVDAHPRPMDPGALYERIHDLLAQGADLVELTVNHLPTLDSRETADGVPERVALLLDDPEAPGGGARAVLEPADRAGFPPDAVDRCVLDAGDDPVVAAVGICRGYRLIRTTDLVSARRVRDVLAAVMDPS